MERSLITRAALAALAGAGLGLGCASTPDDSSQQPGFREGMGEGSDLTGEERVPTRELQTVYFDFDMALIRDDQKPTLQTNGTAIQNHADWRRITLEGYCDERGSEEYNLALGERRANSVKRYLETLGVPAARLDTVSFGESNPAVAGHDESAWRYNRRVEFRVTR
jgi:peptidoglycan-associated lipoprotein